jgi:hypothetical protein
MSTAFRLTVCLALAALVAGCGANKTLGPQKDLGEFRLGHNVVIADNAETIPLSRDVDVNEMEEVMISEIDKRLGRYEGRQLYHVGVTVAGYFIAPPGVPVVASPKSVMILLVNVWDDAAQKKLTAEPHQITVFESAGFGTLAGSGYLQKSDEQVLDLVQNAVAEIEAFIEENPDWFKAKPGLEQELRNVVIEESGGAEAVSGASAVVATPQTTVQTSPAQSHDKPKPRPLPL